MSSQRLPPDGGGKLWIQKAPRQFSLQAGFGEQGTRRVPGSGRQPGRGLRGVPGQGGGALLPKQRRAWLTEQRIRRRAGGARSTQQSHSPARGRGARARGRRGRAGDRGGCRGLPPHSPGQRRPAGCCGRGLAAGRGTPFAQRLMSASAAGELCTKPGGLRAAPRGSSCPARGSARGPRGGSAEAKRERETVRARSCAPRGLGPRRPAPPAAPLLPALRAQEGAEPQKL